MAAQYCGSLTKNSQAYYACEATNQRERFEVQRQQEAWRQEQIQRAILNAHEAEVRLAYEAQAEQQRRMEVLENERKFAAEQARHRAELLPILNGLERAASAAQRSDCLVALAELDATATLLELAPSEYVVEGKRYPKDDLELRVIKARQQAEAVCSARSELAMRLLAVVESEAARGNKSAKALLAKSRARVPAKAGR